MLNKLAWAFAALALIGFGDSLYLAAGHYSGAFLSCGIGECNEVLRSDYSTFMGVPVAVFGAAYYLTIFLLSIYYLDSRRTGVLALAAHLTWAGLLAALYFVGLQLFVIEAYCVYCLISAATSTLLFVVGRVVFVWVRREEVA